MECQPGFALKSERCEPFICKCKAKGNKFGAIGGACPKEGAEACLQCERGMSLAGGKQCSKNVCECPMGTPVEGADCPSPGFYRCKDCKKKPGYTLLADIGVCRLNICTCKHGTPAIGEDCPEMGRELCFDDVGARAEDKPVCQCRNGSPTTYKGEDCREDGSQYCRKCEKGFHLQGKVCYENRCRCVLGSPARGVGCPEHGAFLGRERADKNSPKRFPKV